MDISFITYSFQFTEVGVISIRLLYIILSIIDSVRNSNNSFGDLINIIVFYVVAVIVSLISLVIYFKKELEQLRAGFPFMYISFMIEILSLIVGSASSHNFNTYTYIIFGLLGFQLSVIIIFNIFYNYYINIDNYNINTDGFIFDSIKIEDESEVINKDCSICIEQLKVVGNSVCKLECNHYFHEKCLTEWLTTTTNKSCPNCRHIVLTT